ncbi:MAG: archaellin/type IV pilin N-terminal domain-containing protein [Dehalococcoidia bacterium]
MLNKLINRISKDERGITGLETAIILIAFIVVASVFAYTVLSAGLFSSQKAEETIHSGIGTAQSTMEMKGGNVIAYKGTANGDECITKLSFTISNALESGTSIDLTPAYYIDSNGALASPMISNCNTVWTASASVTAALDSSDYKEAPRSVKLTVADGFTTGLAAYFNTPTRDLTAAAQASIWIKSSLAQEAGNLQLLLCSDDAGATPIGTDGADGTLDIPALNANEWKQAIIDLPDPGALAAVESIGLKAVADPGATVIYLDEIRIVFSGGGTGRNVTMIAYDDGTQVIDNVAWTVEFSGGYESDGDYLMDMGENATITVWLQGYDGAAYSNGSGNGDPFIDSNTNHLKTNDMFHLQVMPPKGATLLVEKRTPAYLSPVMRLY